MSSGTMRPRKHRHFLVGEAGLFLGGEGPRSRVGASLKGMKSSWMMIRRGLGKEEGVRTKGWGKRRGLGGKGGGGGRGEGWRRRIKCMRRCRKLESSILNEGGNESCESE